MPNLDNLALDYTQLQEAGIILAMIVAIATAVIAGVRRIYCKGKNDSILNERINLLEQWKASHIKEYQKLQDINDEVKNELSEVGKKISYLIGLYEGNGTKES